MKVILISEKNHQEIKKFKEGHSLTIQNITDVLLSFAVEKLKAGEISIEAPAKESPSVKEAA